MRHLYVIHTGKLTSPKFQLRYSPTLANKPKGPSRDPSQPYKTFDPFECPPPALKLTDLGRSHILVLNKFAVVPEHFILATRDFKHQTHVLEESDLEATLACIEAYEESKEDDNGLFSFFNCGEHSGASQPHRHIQLLPISHMSSDLEEHSPWVLLADQLDVYQPPFTAFVEKIKLGMSGRELHEAYLRLYKRACRATAVHLGQAQRQQIPVEGESLISYNMAMTKSTLVLAPRLAEGAEIVDLDGHVLGALALNGTVLAGTALVKNEIEWEALQKYSGALFNVLRGIGIPKELIDENPLKL